MHAQLRRCLLLLGFTLAACGTNPARDANDARESLAAAERAFAADAGERGVAAAFIAHFAPDGLVFEPAPVRVRDVWPTRPVPGDPLAVQLHWAPALVDVARSGDLGYSTGPFTVARKGSTALPTHGAFFSVWQRAADGRWQVWLDLGMRRAAPVEAAAFQQRPAPPPDAEPSRAGNPPRSAAAAASAPLPGAATGAAIMAEDVALSELDARAFAGRLAEHARLQREPGTLLIGPAWQVALAADATRSRYAPREARVAAAGDLAASWGDVQRNRPGGATIDGHYVHVWLRRDERWWLAVEATIDDPR